MKKQTYDDNYGKTYKLGEGIATNNNNNYGKYNHREDIKIKTSDVNELEDRYIKNRPFLYKRTVILFIGRKFLEKTEELYLEARSRGSNQIYQYDEKLLKDMVKTMISIVISIFPKLSDEKNNNKSELREKIMDSCETLFHTAFIRPLLEAGILKNKKPIYDKNGFEEVSINNEEFNFNSILENFVKRTFIDIYGIEIDKDIVIKAKFDLEKKKLCNDIKNAFSDKIDAKYQKHDKTIAFNRVYTVYEDFNMLQNSGLTNLKLLADDEDYIVFRNSILKNCNITIKTKTNEDGSIIETFVMNKNSNNNEGEKSENHKKRKTSKNHTKKDSEKDKKEEKELKDQTVKTDEPLGSESVESESNPVEQKDMTGFGEVPLDTSETSDSENKSKEEEIEGNLNEINNSTSEETTHETSSLDPSENSTSSIQPDVTDETSENNNDEQVDDLNKDDDDFVDNLNKNYKDNLVVDLDNKDDEDDEDNEIVDFGEDSDETLFDEKENSDEKLFDEKDVEKKEETIE